MRFPRLMADPAAPLAYYHCLSRVVNREFVFGPPEKEHFVRILRQYERFCGLRIVTFCILSNHFHVLLEVPQRPRDFGLSDEDLLERLGALDMPLQVAQAREMLARLRERGQHEAAEACKASYLARMWDLSSYMKLVKQRFTQWFNRRHRRKGTLWEERFKSVLVESASAALATMAAYIDLNPVRARLVSDPQDYRWCGYAQAISGDRRALAGLAAIDAARAAHVERPATRKESLENYRVWLFGRGEQREGLLEEEGTVGPVGRAGIAPGRVAEVKAAKGKLTHWEMLRCRVRYFSDGVALGTKAWVDGVFALRRERFGPKRKTGARPLRHLDAPTLHTLRDLRLNAIG